MKEYAGVIKTEGAVLGDTLESALELGEKYEEIVTDYKTVSNLLMR